MENFSNILVISPVSHICSKLTVTLIKKKNFPNDASEESHDAVGASWPGDRKVTGLNPSSSGNDCEK